MKFSIFALTQLYAVADARSIFSRKGGGNTLWGRPRLATRQDDNNNSWLLSARGGYQTDEDTLTEMSLDEKVQAAMKKLGLPVDNDDGDCPGGVCPMPTATVDNNNDENADDRISEDQVWTKAAEIAKSMQVDESLVMAALGATATIDPVNKNTRMYSESAARAMIQQELDLIDTIPTDSDAVQQLVSEGHDQFLSRRALAFAEGNMDDARAILVADAEDWQQAQLEEEEAEKQAQQQQQAAATAPPAPAPQKEEFKTVTVNSNFDPTKVSAGGASAPLPTPNAPPKPANKADVVFEATTAQIQELVLESPVPVLVDVYADWCGPCKVLGPILEDMAVKSGGMFRLVKINSDNERPVSAALGVSALPTVFGVRDGKIRHMFKGMPRDEEFMKNFLMGLLVPGASFKPPVTQAEQDSYDDMTGKLVKMAGAACFPFSARERLQERVSTLLDKLVEETGDASRTEDSAMVVRSLFSNVIKNPYEAKYRSANLANQKIAALVTAFPSAVAMLKTVGFVKSEDGNSMTLGKGKKLVNVAPLMVARDSIDKWVDQSRYEIARAARKRRDEEDRARLEAEGHFDKEEEEEEVVEEKVVDMDACELKVRLEGKKKVLEMSFSADDPVKSILSELPSKPNEEEEVQITCVSKRLVLKSTDDGAFDKTFRELGLSPAAAVVVSVGGPKAREPSAGKLSERAAQKKRKKGSHTMQSVGIYAKDDNAKAELIDGGGGVWYEHDVTDDEEEETKDDEEEEAKDDEEETASEDKAQTGDAETGDDEQED